MRKTKKLTALLLALTLLFACAACGSGNSTTDSGKTISGTLPEIIDRLYDTVDVDDEQRDAEGDRRRGEHEARLVRQHAAEGGGQHGQAPRCFM